MMKDNKVPEILRPFCSPGEAEAAGIEAGVSPRPSKAPKGPSSPVSRLSLESLENPFLTPQPTPIHWSVGWADLMMTMFILFLVMHLYSSANLGNSTGMGVADQGEMASDRGGQGSATLQRPDDGSTVGHSGPDASKTAKLFDLTKFAKDDAEFASFAEIDLSPDRTVRIILAADLLFPSGSTDLRLFAKENIKKISELLQSTPHRINVVGHTDDQPTRGGAFATNWELSVLRATTVARFLIEDMDVSASRITASGQSFYQPQVSNSNPVNRAKNRRVEIIVSLDPGPASLLASSNIVSKSGGE